MNDGEKITLLVLVRVGIAKNIQSFKAPCRLTRTGHTWLGRTLVQKVILHQSPFMGRSGVAFVYSAETCGKNSLLVPRCAEEPRAGTASSMVPSLDPETCRPITSLEEVKVMNVAALMS